MKSKNPNKELAVLVLAAGSSRRLGQPKQLVEWKGRTLLENSIISSQSVSKNINVVLGSNADKIIPSIEHLDITSLIFDGWEEGMGASLSFGIEELLKSNSHTEQLLVLVCDQVYVSSDLLIDLVKTHQSSDNQITACNYGDSFGIPVIFGKEIFEELQSLKGDRGAKKIIQKNIHHTGFIDFPDGEVDVDRPGDLES